MNASLYKEWSDSEKKVFREWVISHLKYGPVSVSFLKKDGTVREMNCTLKEELVKQYEKKTDRVKNVNEETCPVFDIDKQEWRSFRYDSVTIIRFEV